MSIFDKIKCLFGNHDWLIVDGSRKKTGYAIAAAFSPAHELQEDGVCANCRLYRRRFGLIKPLGITKLSNGDTFDYDSDGWPVDNENKRLTHRPNYTYTTIKKTEYFGKIRDTNLKLLRPIK